MPAALDVDWNLGRLLAAQGLNYKDISEKIGASHEAVRQRASREKWDQFRPSQGDRNIVTACHAAASVVKSTLSERANAYAGRVFDKVSGLVEGASLPPPKNWKDLEVADRVARRAGGLDRPEAMAAVQVNMWGGGEAGGELLDLQSEVVHELPEESPPPSGEITD